MSKYTTEVRYICETVTGYDQSQGYKKVDEIITAAAPKIFNFDFPIFDEDYRLGLEKKILKHYYTREICAETVGLWKLWLDARMNDIMPYYNQLYESALIEFNPLYDTDLTTDYNKAKEGTTTDTGSQVGTSTSTTQSQTVYDEDTTSTAGTEGTTKTVTDKDTVGSSTRNTETETQNTHYDLYSDTPQGALDGVESQEYLTNARKVTDDGTTTGTETISSNVAEDTTETGTYNEDATGSGTKDSTTTGTSTTTGETTKNTEDNGTSNSTEEYLQHIVGKSHGISYSQFLQEYRETFLNIDLQIINELSDLFMGLW